MKPTVELVATPSDTIMEDPTSAVPDASESMPFQATDETLDKERVSRHRDRRPRHRSTFLSHIRILLHTCLENRRSLLLRHSCLDIELMVNAKQWKSKEASHPVSSFLKRMNCSRQVCCIVFENKFRNMSTIMVSKELESTLSSRLPQIVQSVNHMLRC